MADCTCKADVCLNCLSCQHFPTRTHSTLTVAFRYRVKVFWCFFGALSYGIIVICIYNFGIFVHSAHCLILLNVINWFLNCNFLLLCHWHDGSYFIMISLCFETAICCLVELCNCTLQYDNLAIGNNLLGPMHARNCRSIFKTNCTLQLLSVVN